MNIRSLKNFSLEHTSTFAWIILFASLLITLAASYISYTSMKFAADTRFKAQTFDVSKSITERMKEQEVTLRGGLGLFNASVHVTREEWHKYTRSLILEKHLPGLQGFGYAEFVSADTLKDYIQRVRAEGFPDFDIYPKHQRDIYTSIIYLEPFRDRNLRAFGYDMFTEPTRREAMERARDTGNVAVSGIVTLVQETDSDIQAGFLMYVPVFEKDADILTVEGRRNSIKGYVYSPFRVRDLMQGVLGSGNSSINFQIYDGAEISESRRLFDSGDGQTKVGGDAESPLESIAQLNIGGRTWTLRFKAASDFIPEGEQNQPLYIAIGGIVVDILLFVTINSLFNQRQRARSVASRMTEELLEAKEQAESAARNEAEMRILTQATNEKLSIVNSDLKKFNSIVAHDLRSPLTRIESFTKILREENNELLNGGGNAALDRIEVNSVKMRMILDALLDFSQNAEHPDEEKKANIYSVVSDLVGGSYESNSGAEISVDINKNLCVNINPTLLGRVVENLLDNSIKYRKKTSAKIQISARLVCDNMIELAVTDNGIGIDPEYVDSVFDMFTRLHNDEDYSGVGVGLALCKKIVTDCGGDISIDKDWADGARVVVHLPGGGNPQT